MSSNTNAPGLVASHAKYVQGAAEEVIGSVTGSQEWQNSGDSIKANAVNEMREATQNRNAESSGFGKAEQLAGKAVGCEGMEKEGAASKTS